MARGLGIFQTGSEGCCGYDHKKIPSKKVKRQHWHDYHHQQQQQHQQQQLDDVDMEVVKEMTATTNDDDDEDGVDETDYEDDDSIIKTVLMRGKRTNTAFKRKRVHSVKKNSPSLPRGGGGEGELVPLFQGEECVHNKHHVLMRLASSVVLLYRTLLLDAKTEPVVNTIDMYSKVCKDLKFIVSVTQMGDSLLSSLFLMASHSGAGDGFKFLSASDNSPTSATLLNMYLMIVKFSVFTLA